MKEITKTYQIYTFDELSKEAKERAISDHIDCAIELFIFDDTLSYIGDSVEKAEQQQTPWFLASIIYEDHKEDVIDTIKANQYGFFEDGELISLDMYPDGWTD